MKPGKAAAAVPAGPDRPRPEWWRPLPWQSALWLDLSALLLQKRLPHALLLAGGAGIGKRWFARALIAYGLCEKPSGYACGQCRSCLQLSVGSHPDAALLNPDGHRGLALNEQGWNEQGLTFWQPDEDRKRRDIAIDAARSLMDKLNLGSHYGKGRYTLIEPADALNTSSVNALLKTIEEPPAGMQLLLVSERPQALPATLRSRCQRIRFPMPDTQAAQTWMAEQGIKDREALDYAYGAPLRALSLKADEGVVLRREWEGLWRGIVSGRKDPLEVAAQIDKDRLAEHLHWAQYWLGQQLREQLDAAAAIREAYAQMLQDVIEAQRRAHGNAQPQLLMEALLTRCMRLARSASL